MRRFNALAILMGLLVFAVAGAAPAAAADLAGEGAGDGNLAAGKAADASRTCRSGTGTTVPHTGGISLQLPTSFGVLLLSLGLLAAVLRRV
jgi:LPXTG-motif cell wall-anchored protein